MNKYSDKSDFEINKEVVKLIKTKGGYSCVDYDEIVKVYVSQNTGIYKEFDPCNNPADAMPIINEYGISLMYKEREFQVATNDGNYYCCMSNPLKAAMVIFLMMKDAENES
ncbi:DUF2591 domain-containing protein [Morganella morganii]|uniref:phage protein NinX family protein n=1 Tax=Morganella morganii TaxID=582 RepID=UPI000E223089|nr:phage protein NinX family protein [Morganella morganii]REL18953.1 DUF2591 domain-containing protein [Morganella morganii]HDU8494366.1 DUF2591 family protein [Morganella morganii]